MSFEVAGALDLAGRTAWASVNSLHLTADDTVLVSAAAGGVGVLAVQLARRTGARVIGTASEANHDFLRGLDVIPVAYGEGLLDRVRQVAPRADGGARQSRSGHHRLALKLGAPGSRINTIAARGHRADAGITGVSGRPRPSPTWLSWPT